MVDFDSGDLTIFANWKMDENGPWKSIIYADLLPGLPIYPHESLTMKNVVIFHSYVK